MKLESTVIPAAAGWHAVLPMIGEGFRLEGLTHAPVVAWRITAEGDALPVLPEIASAGLWATGGHDCLPLRDPFGGYWAGGLPLPSLEEVRAHVEDEIGDTLARAAKAAA